jgi:hypothetical protein
LETVSMSEPSSRLKFTPWDINENWTG